jgi:N-acetyl-gamma-glutamyl-phosphate reductase
MWVEVPLPLSPSPAASPDALRKGLAAFYEGSAVVRVAEAATPMNCCCALWAQRRADAVGVGARDGHAGRLVAVLDNLGKGASGAAVQSLNLMAGLPETAGLAL